MTQSLLHKFWYVVAECHELKSTNILSRQILNEWIACYRDVNGKATVVQDVCLHRCARLSNGTVNKGLLTCHYHGWVYGEEGKVVDIPTQFLDDTVKRSLKARTYATQELDGYIYVCLQYEPDVPPPFIIPRPDISSSGCVRLQNRFMNTLANCVENYIDVPHTAYVHRGIFRKPKQQPLQATIRRQGGHVSVDYHGETANLGSFSWLLNPKGGKVEHQDHFFAPNITSVHYRLSSGFSYFITSQSVPVSTMETMVYTDISYDFGLLTPLTKWMVRRQAQRVINQDIEILKEQGEVIQKYGERFYATPVDYMHSLTREIIQNLESGKPLSTLENKEKEIWLII